ncbi:PA2778 family cysteine peptidase [Pelovirga terrestris]|uniref:PA2778 family cysteine peptidase n=1 Tax=Pelovirga terrestris TaxID=2771352 RepID=A0A8J6QR13_9BACT|nr:PA2778 family cysteine peptidase [Pelovirga terrestris]MBD1400523.1 PA2778 family cysteine peptidase [Pelovirga terrestris]
MLERSLKSAGRRWLACAFFGSFILIASGCSSYQYPHALRPEPQRLHLSEAPFFAQQEYQCGPAALAMLLAWNGHDVFLPQLEGQVYSPELQGSLQPSIVAAARRQGYLAYPLSGWSELVAELKGGQPVMILQNLGLSWYPRWHYAVVIGYDQGEKRVRLHSGVYPGMEMSMGVFERTWRRADYWGLVVVPPSVLPSSATEIAYLTAVVGLERARQFSAATTAYLTATKAWPDSFVAWIGAGNSSYQAGDTATAIRSFRQAAALRPDDGIPLNNLALVLAQAGRRTEALAVIDQAIAQGGDRQEVFRQTRQKIVADSAPIN